jgi:poly-gamma-glutamate capsule biosynthesis protein CapA/YwtB (metallophosphatase superfamily)
MQFGVESLGGRPVSRRGEEGAGPTSRWLRAVAGGAVAGMLVGAGAACEPPPAPGPSSAERGDEASEGPRRRDGQAAGFTIAASGDILVHSAVSARAAEYGDGSFDFRPMFEPVRALISEADLAVCHVETPLSPTNEGLASYPMFNAPREVAGAAAYAGFDACSTASNHSYDRQLEGVAGTLEVLDEAGLVHVGTARSRAERNRTTLLRVKGFVVGLLSYTYQLNTTAVPTEPWSVNIIDERTILADARKARRRGAEFVIVSLQWGVEYQSAPTSEQRSLARRLLRSPAVDLILGHHAHVVQPIGRVGKEYVVFGMGNFLSNQSAECCLPETQDGVIVRIEVTEERDGLRVTGLGYTPTWVDRGSYRILPVRDWLDQAGTRKLRRALRISWERTVAAIEAAGVRAQRDP